MAGAQRRIRICSPLLNRTLINAPADVLRAGVPVGGIYDRTQMAAVYRQWQEVPSNRWKVPALHDIIARAHLAGKNSTPYSLEPSRFHAHKILVIDDTVITGSFTTQRQFNAENILIIESAALADCYSNYIDHLVQKVWRRHTFLQNNHTMSVNFEELDFRETRLGDLMLRRRRILSLDGLEVYETARRRLRIVEHVS